MNFICIAVDDDQTAIDELTEYIENIPKLKLEATFIKPLEALAYLKVNQVDLVFMDVDMPLMTGIELAAMIRKKTDKLIFTTSHARYALDAFAVSASDFLLKPFTFAKVLESVDKIFPAEKDNAQAVMMNEENKDDYIFVKNRDEDFKLIKVMFKDIVAVESLLNYVRIHTVKDKLVTHISLKEAKDALGHREEFVQLHRSFIISKTHIVSLTGNTLTMSSGAKFTIGESYKDSLDGFLTRNLLKPAQKK